MFLADEAQLASFAPKGSYFFIVSTWQIFRANYSQVDEANHENSPYSHYLWTGGITYWQ